MDSRLAPDGLWPLLSHLAVDACLVLVTIIKLDHTVQDAIVRCAIGLPDLIVVEIREKHANLARSEELLGALVQGGKLGHRHGSLTIHEAALVLARPCHEDDETIEMVDASQLVYNMGNQWLWTPLLVANEEVLLNPVAFTWRGSVVRQPVFEEVANRMRLHDMLRVVQEMVGLPPLVLEPLETGLGPGVHHVVAAVLRDVKRRACGGRFVEVLLDRNVCRGALPRGGARRFLVPIRV